MVRTRRLERRLRQALAGIALAALLAWEPLGMGAYAPAYADESGAQAAADVGPSAGDGSVGTGVTFDAVLPDEASFDANESEAALIDASADTPSEGDSPLAGEGAAAADENGSLTSTNDALSATADGTLPADESTPAAATDNLLASADDAAPLPDAAALSDLDAALASGDPIAQVQALGIATDPSQVEGYDPAADGEFADYDESVSDDEGIAAQSDTSIRVGDWSYHESTSDDGDTVYVLDGYYGSAASITLPATLGGKQMYSVLFGSSGLPKTVTSVTIPASIKEIGAKAFVSSKVASVTFEANSQLTAIGEEAFAYSSLTEFTIPENVKTLGYQAFRSSSLKKLTLNTNLEPMVYTYALWLGDDSFSLPAQTVEVTEHFNPCAGCKNVTFVAPSGCKNYCVVNGALLSRDGTILYAQPSNLGGGTYTVPSGVKILGSYAMYDNVTFSQIVLPQGLTTMENNCLSYTSIASLDIPDSVTLAQDAICTNCTSLTSVRVGNGLEELGVKAGSGCFSNCTSLTSLTLGSKLRIIGNRCFQKTGLASVDLPANVEQLNYLAFGDNASLKSVTGATGLRYIYKRAFANTGLTSFPFGESLRFVSNTAFDGCTFTPSYPSYMDEQTDGYHAYNTFAVRGSKSYTLAWQVLDQVNQERAKENLEPLAMDAELLEVAMRRAAELTICYSHTRPTGQMCFTASSKMSLENIASGLTCTTAEAVVGMWMSSDGHRANILSSGSKSIGIGCVKVGDCYFWAQCFGGDEATTVSQPADVSDALLTIDYTTDGLTSFGSRFEIYPVASDGTTIVSTSGALQEGTSQRYALFTYPWGAKYNVVTPIDNSCVTWSLSSTGAKLDASTATVTATGAGSFTLTASVGGDDVKQTLTRQTSKAVYTVSFNSNGGSSVAKQSVTSGEKAAKPSNPTRTGYTFTGWFSDSGLKQAYDFGTAVKGNLTLYAGWRQITYTVSFNSNGGSGVADQTVAWGAKANKPADPTKASHNFAGWYSDSGLTKAYDFGTAVKSNLTLYAKWTTQPTYTVSFNANGGSGVASQTVTSGSKANKPSDPTRAGYTFTGWYGDSTLATTYNFNTAVKSNLTLHAGWKQITYTVSFNSNGGSAVASQTVAWGAKASKPANPTRSGYTFGGWYSDSALTKAYDFGAAVKGNLTLYAKWTAVPTPSSFKDVASGEWYAGWVSQAAQAGLMTGMKDAGGNYTGYFDPERGITRAEVATVLWRIAGSPGATACPLPDVSGHWAQAAVSWCYAKGVVTGYTAGANAGKFLPDAQVSRQELAVMVWRFAKWAGAKTANPPASAFNSCGDTYLVPDWSRDAMTWCAAAGVITGVQGGARPMLAPEGGATRAMAAKIFVQTQKITSGAMTPYSEDGAAEEAQAAGADVTFDDVQDGAADSAADTDGAFDAVEPGESGSATDKADAADTSDKSDGSSSDAPDQTTETNDGATGAPGQSTETTDTTENAGADDSASASEPSDSAAPADSADTTESSGAVEPDAAGEPEGAADPTESAALDSFDSIAA